MDLKDLATGATIIIVVGLLLGIGIFVMSEIRTSVASEYTGTDADINLTDSAGTTTLTDSTKDDYYLSAIVVTNFTDAVIPSTQYSFTSAGVVTWIENLYNGTSAYYTAGEEDVLVTSTYIYDVANSPEEGIGDAMDGLGDFAGWIAVIVVVLAAAIVLGIVLKGFSGGRKI